MGLFKTLELKKKKFTNTCFTRDIIWGDIVRGNFVRGFFFVLGGYCPGGFCPGGYCPGNFVRGGGGGGGLSWGDIVRGILSRGILSWYRPDNVSLHAQTYACFWLTFISHMWGVLRRTDLRVVLFEGWHVEAHFGRKSSWWCICPFIIAHFAHPLESAFIKLCTIFDIRLIAL